jgi:hypothetical protein
MAFGIMQTANGANIDDIEVAAFMPNAECQVSNANYQTPNAKCRQYLLLAFFVGDSLSI